MCPFGPHLGRQNDPQNLPKTLQNEAKINEKSMKNRCEKKLVFFHVFAIIFLDFRPQNPPILACILKPLAKQVPKMQNLKNMRFTWVKSLLSRS